MTTEEHGKSNIVIGQPGKASDVTRYGNYITVIVSQYSKQIKTL